LTELNNVNDQNSWTSTDWDRQVIEAFRANGGNPGGQFTGVPVLLLTTRGAKSGEPRTRPLTYLRDAGHIYVFAGKGCANQSRLVSQLALAS
jgi:hypothetical protein